MNCESCDEPKNSRTAATAGLALIRSFGITVDTSTDDMRSLTARSMRSRPTRYWFSSSSPTERTRRLPRLSISSISPLPSFRFTSSLTTARMSSLRSVVTVSSARSEEHTSELQSLMRISYAVFCLKKKKNTHTYKMCATHTMQEDTNRLQHKHQNTQHNVITTCNNN